MTPTPRSTFAALALGAYLLVGATACGSGDGAGPASAQGTGPSAPATKATVAVEDATIDWPANPEIASVNMVVRNGTAEPDTLLSVGSPIAERASIHRTSTDADGRSTMTPQDDLAIPARSSMTFAPGGLHVMLAGITADLEVGDDVQLTLTFERAGTVTATATVVKPGTAGEDPEGSHDH